MQIRFVNARILTMCDKPQVKENMQLFVENGKIIFVGTPDEGEQFVRAYPCNDVTVKDCRGNLLMPGFKNAHTHSAMTFLRSKADDMALHDWLNKQVFPVEAKLTYEDVYIFTKLAVLEYLQSGITGICDMYLFPEAIEAACTKMGMRATLVSGLNNFSHSIELVNEWLDKFNQEDSLIRFLPGFHAEYTTDISLLKEIAGLSKEYKLPVYAHISETADEVKGCMERYGKTPVMFLDSINMFEYGGGGYHLVYATEEEWEILAKKNIFAVTNPSSNLKLASGIAPVDKWLEHGVKVAIGTDGPASNNALDFFREMFLVATLSKAISNNPTVVSCEEVLKMACVNGAYAMGVAESDSLAVGKNADIIMIDLNEPNMQPVHNCIANIVYAGSKKNVCMTMIAGRILYENNKFYLDETPEEIYKAAKARCDIIFE